LETEAVLPCPFENLGSPEGKALVPTTRSRFESVKIHGFVTEQLAFGDYEKRN